MTHWMTRVAHEAGFDGADTLAFRPDTSVEDIWAATVDACGVTPTMLAMAVGNTYQLEVVDLQTAEPTAAKLIPGSIARKLGVFAIRDADRYLIVATSNPTNPEIEQEVRFASGRTPWLAIAPPEEILNAIEQAYSADVAAASLLERLNVEFDASNVVEIRTDGEDIPEEITAAETASGPIVRLTNIVLHEAVVRGASDVHIQPGASGGVVRFRLDGVLQSGVQMPLQVLVRVVSRIKIISGMDITDRMRPQDGRARIEVAGNKYDLRVSTVPTRLAEKAVIRILDPRATGTLDDTGIERVEVERIRRTLSRRDGIFVVTGPTGSGKTTTLYGALREIATEDVNIMTVEDPVEYEIPGLTQIQVELKQGVTFASALRAVLRQDPDVIFVGEIRDQETAGIAAQASLTGHLVLATLHTNDAIGSIRRFIDLGLDPIAVVETLRGAFALRLVRRLCPHCAEPAPDSLTVVEEKLQERYGCPVTIRAKGCDRCVNQGYFGRIPVTEFLTPSRDLIRLVLDDAPPFELQNQAAGEGMRTLMESALARVRAGETTLEEVERVVGTADQPQEKAASRSRVGHAAAPTDTGGASPRNGDARPVEHSSENGEFAPEFEPPHVLLVDDDAGIRLIARAILEKLDYRVSEAADGSEALARLAKGEFFNLMVLDLDMPLLGGREVLRAVRRSLATAGLPVVVLTGTPDPEAEVELMEEGADDYIRKPIDPPRFQSRIKAAVRRARG